MNKDIKVSLVAELSNLHDYETKVRYVSEGAKYNLAKLAKHTNACINIIASLLIGTKLSLNQCSRVLNFKYQSISDYTLNGGFDADINNKNTKLVKTLNSKFNGIGNLFNLVADTTKTIQGIGFTGNNSQDAHIFYKDIHELLTQVLKSLPKDDWLSDSELA